MPLSKVVSNSLSLTTLAASGAATLSSTLGVTGVTTVQAGTVALPAITTTGDTNTGIFFPAADTIAFAEGGAEAMRINASGNLQTIGTISVGNATPSTSGAGITFPATQSASSDANTLDDYEEGTWTPSFSFSSGSVAYYDQYGLYTKVGNLVTITFWLRIVSVSSPSGSVSIAGLPFNSGGTATRPAALFRNRSLSGVTGIAGAWLSTNSNTLTCEVYNNGSGSDLNGTSLIGNTEIDGFFSYQI